MQEIKRRLCSADKIPTNSLFYFDGQKMLDPLSLNDIPGVVGRNALQIEVKVNITHFHVGPGVCQQHRTC